MNIFRVVRRIVVFILCMCILTSWSEAQISKVDPLLKVAYSRVFKGNQKTTTAQEAALQLTPMKALMNITPSAEPLVTTLVRFETEPDTARLAALKAKIVNQIGNIAVVTMPLAAINDLAAEPFVGYIEASRMNKPYNDAGNVAIGATTARTTEGVDGTGVIVGVVDSGIDTKHDDFRNPDGSTRILYVLDFASPGDTNQDGVPDGPDAYGGTEWTAAEINSANGGGTAVVQVDPNGHGTHVSGSATGNGRATNGAVPAGIYAGVAPKADIIFVKGVASDASGFPNDYVVNGLSYIFDKAATAGKPCVINLSLGGHYSPHDGSSNYEQSVANFVGTGKNGKIICCANGNEGADNIHAGATVTQGGNQSTSFTVSSGVSTVVINLWYEGSDSFGVVAQTPGGAPSPTQNPGDTFQSTPQPDGTVIQIEHSNNNANNNDKEVLIYLFNPSGAVTPGTWNFSLAGTTVSSGRWDAWAVSGCVFASNLEADRSVGSPATSNNVIGVGSFITKNSWQSLDGNTWSNAALIPGAPSSFSSLGPTRDGRQRPHLLAPGELIMSVHSIAAPGSGQYSIFSPPGGQSNDFFLSRDGKHAITQGTSMASPHITGLVALMLQKNPNLDSTTVISALTSTADVDGQTGAVPNTKAGYGKADAVGALAAITGGQQTAGDVNNDGQINSFDAILVMRHLSGAVPLTGNALTAANADGDGDVDNDDVDKILQLAVGL
jgi:subtilisin family serine protease